MTKFNLSLLGNQWLEVTVDGDSGNINSSLERETCPFCNSPTCTFQCDGSKIEYEECDDENDIAENEEEVRRRLQYNAVLDCVESMVLAHAAAGVNVADPNYVAGINTALEAAENNI